MISICDEWKNALSEELEKPYFKAMWEQISEEYKTREIFPPKDEVFNAFNYAPLSKVKCVIIGQDPYHNVGQAHGLCFSVKPGVAIPPSLANIYKELHEDVDFQIPDNGYLEKWAKQGILMLNTVLTVRAHEANSHKEMGWERFTDAVIKILNEQKRPIVYLLWGTPAQRKASKLDNTKHLLLKAPHPSPLSAYRGFFGCRHFSKTNEFLTENGLEPIDWSI